VPVRCFAMLEARGLDSPHQVEAEVGPEIRAIKRPHDLEALEYGEDLVVYLEPFMGRFPREIAAMGIEPPLSRAVPFPSSQANASSTSDSGLIVTSVVRQMNRGRPSPSGMMTKSPNLGVGSRPSP
jgi:hypothetical protein